MIIGVKRFNTYFLAMLMFAFFCGCQSPESKKKSQLSTLGVHLEASADGTSSGEEISVPRNAPVRMIVEKGSFLTQNNVTEARILDAVGGFGLRLQFDRRGTWLLEQYTSGNGGKHLAVFSQFISPPEEKLNKGRWLAAPRINHRISNGVLIFTPDATREEAEQIVLGLNNLARQLKKKTEQQ